jgi:hypothetical protein
MILFPDAPDSRRTVLARCSESKYFPGGAVQGVNNEVQVHFQIQNFCGGTVAAFPVAELDTTQ